MCILFDTHIIFLFGNNIRIKIISTITNSKLENLKKCKQIKFVTFMYLPNQPTPIKIMGDSYLDLILSANVNYSVKVK